MMISPSWGLATAAAWGEGLFSRIRRATRMSRRPEAEPRPCGIPGRCLQVGFDRHQQRLASRASVPDALPAAARRAGRRSWRRTRSAMPQAAQTRRRPSDPCRARWRHSSPRPPPPQRAEGLRLGLQQFHLHGQLSDPLHGAIQFRLHRIALALLERGVDPADRLRPPISNDRITGSPENDLT